MELAYDNEFNQRLFDVRRVTFDDALESLCADRVIAHFPYPNPNQGDACERHVFVVSIGGEAYFLPYVLTDKKGILETVCPCERRSMSDGPQEQSQAPMEYLNVEEQAVIERLRRVNLKTAPKATPKELTRMKRAAKKLLRRERKGALRVPADSVQRTHERAGKMGSQTGVTGRW